MSDAIDAKPFPRSMLLGAAALIGAALIATTAARLTGVGTTHVQAGQPVESRLLTFKKTDSGGIKVISAETGIEIADLPAKKDGFVGVLLQGFGGGRMRAGVDVDAPYRLVRYAGGRAGLDDPETGRSVMLDAFGPDNFQAFNRLFKKEVTAP